LDKRRILSADIGTRMRIPILTGHFNSRGSGILILLLLTVVLTGCFRHTAKEFSPTRGMVCDDVTITGTFYHIGRLDGVWFDGVEAPAEFVRNPPPDGPLQIDTNVPVGATTGPIRVKISTGFGIILGVLGTDHKFDEPFTVVGSPPAPTISSFTATPASIVEGQSTALNWAVSGTVSALTLNNSSVLGDTSASVSPVTTTTYLLRAFNRCLSSSKSLTVAVTPLPKISSLAPGPYHPGKTLAVNGVGLQRSGDDSSLVFTQGAANVTVPAASATPSQITANIPTTLNSGTVGVQAKVGTNLSNSVNFMLDARQNGLFKEVKTDINTTNSSCGGKQKTISFNAPGWPLPILAVFTQGATVLAQHNFKGGAITGAAFSPAPACANAISVSADPPIAAPFQAVVERFDTGYIYQFPVRIMDGFDTVTARWHAQFSPDDKMVLLSSVPSSGPGDIVIRLHDLVQQKDLGSAIFTNCPVTCNELVAEVVNGNSVKITLDGADQGTIAIF